jgi:hypothetical protein
VRVRMRVRAEGLRGGPHGARRRGGKGHGVGYGPRPGCPRGAGRAMPAHVPGQRPRHDLLHWAVLARAHPIHAGPGVNRAKKNGPRAGLTGPCLMYRDGNGYPRPDTRCVFTSLGYVCGLNILPVGLLLGKNLHPMGKRVLERSAFTHTR